MSSVKNDPIGGLFNSIGKAMNNAVKETGQLMTESINDVSKATEEGGFVGGALRAVEEFSPGNVAAGAFDVMTGPGRLNPQVAAGISAVVNMAAGAAIPGAGLPLQLQALKDGAVALGMIGASPSSASPETQQSPEATRSQQPDAPRTGIFYLKRMEDARDARAARREEIKEMKAERKAEARKEAIENAKAKAREEMHERAIENSKLLEKAEAAVARGGGYAEVSDILGDLLIGAAPGSDSVFGMAASLAEQAKANDRVRNKVDKMGDYIKDANNELDKLLNNPNLSFEDMIFLVMQHFMKEQQDEVRQMTTDLGGKKDAFEKEKVGLNAEVDAARKDMATAQATAAKNPKDEKAQAALADAAAKVRGAEERLNNASSDFGDSRAMQFELLKNAMNKLSEMQSTMSNILNAMHQTAMQTIGNIR